MINVIFATLQPILDPDKRISVLRSSQDPELAAYLDFMQAAGSTDMDIDGNIFVKLHDANGLDKLTWMEEFAHALQFLRNGHVSLSCDDRERYMRETEVMDCLLRNADRFRLSQSERSDCITRRQFYGDSQ